MVTPGLLRWRCMASVMQVSVLFCLWGCSWDRCCQQIRSAKQRGQQFIDEAAADLAVEMAKLAAGYDQKSSSLCYLPFVIWMQEACTWGMQPQNYLALASACDRRAHMQYLHKDYLALS